MAEIDSAEITCFMLNELDTHQSSVVSRAAKKFGISRQAALARIRTLIEQGDVEAKGSTKARRYSLASNNVLTMELPMAGLEEDIVYQKEVRPVLGELPDNIQAICNYGFTEMLNNAIDHSESDDVGIYIGRTPSIVEMFVTDSGIGIFEKIKRCSTSNSSSKR